MKEFDPWTASREEMLAQPDLYALRGAYQRWCAAQNILHRRERMERHPIEGVASCVRHGLVVPRWLAAPFIHQYDKVLNCQVDSWDDAFEAPHPAGHHLSTLRLRRLHSFHLDLLFAGADALKRTAAGYREAARQTGLTEKQVRTLLPKTRTNQRGHKPQRQERATDLSAHDPFSIAKAKAPKK